MLCYLYLNCKLALIFYRYIITFFLLRQSFLVTRSNNTSCHQYGQSYTSVKLISNSLVLINSPTLCTANSCYAYLRLTRKVFCLAFIISLSLERSVHAVDMTLYHKSQEILHQTFRKPNILLRCIQDSQSIQLLFGSLP